MKKVRFESDFCEEEIAVCRVHGGRSFVYVLPCADDSLLKIGFSRDPPRRFRSLHRRFFKFFDLDGGALIETETTADAKVIERRLLATFAPFSAPSPVVVPHSSAGHTEWYRGVHDDAVELARTLCLDEGFVFHHPLRPWLKERFRERTGLLYDWSRQMLEMIEFDRFNANPLARPNDSEPALLDTLDLCSAIGLAPESLVPANVAAWYRAASGCRDAAACRKPR